VVRLRGLAATAAARASQIRVEDARSDHLEITWRNVRRNVDVPESTFTVE
jgi:outer membrane lipoprotein-sorting protein